MDPATAITAAAGTFEQLNRIGGAVAVLLGLLVLLAGVAILLSVRAFKHLTKRLGDVEDSRVRILTECVTESTHQSRRAADSNDAILSALRSRPCLIESGVHRTPLPQVRGP